MWKILWDTQPSFFKQVARFGEKRKEEWGSFKLKEMCPLTKCNV